MKFIGLVIQKMLKMLEEKSKDHSKHDRQFNMLEMFVLRNHCRICS